VTDGRERIHERDRGAQPQEDAKPGNEASMGDPGERGTEVRREAVEGSSRAPGERRRPGLDPENAERERRKRSDDPGMAGDGSPRRSSTTHDRPLTPEELANPRDEIQG
jgi:hypothetical protein